MAPVKADPSAFPFLDPSEVAIFEAIGTRRHVTAGEYLYREGDPEYDFWIVVSGAVDENYFGFTTGIPGAELTQRGLVQAEKFGARLSAPCEAIALREEAGHFALELSDGTAIAARAVIAATERGTAGCPWSGCRSLRSTVVCTTPPPNWRRDSARAARLWSSAAATRLVKRRSSSPTKAAP
jgi:hypothetical protein